MGERRILGRATRRHHVERGKMGIGPAVISVFTTSATGSRAMVAMHPKPKLSCGSCKGSRWREGCQSAGEEEKGSAEWRGVRGMGAMEGEPIQMGASQCLQDCRTRKASAKTTSTAQAGAVASAQQACVVFPLGDNGKAYCGQVNCEGQGRRPRSMTRELSRALPGSPATDTKTSRMGLEPKHKK